MAPEELCYWLRLAIGLPMVLLWFGVVVIQAFFAVKGSCSRPLRRFAVGTAMACGAVTAVFGILVAWPPAWYQDWIGSLLLLFVLLSFQTELNCLIWARIPGIAQAPFV